MRNGANGVLVETIDLLDQFRQGDPDAFESLFRLHQRAVYGWILRIVRNPAAAEDLTVETFWRIYQAHARFEPARGLRALGAPHRDLRGAGLAPRRRPESELTADLMARSLRRLAADPGVTAEIRLKTAQAFSAPAAPAAGCGHSGGCRGAAAQRSGRGAGISVAAVKLRVFRALRLLRKDLERQGITP